MIFQNGSEPVPGWQVRFPVKQAENAESYRVVDGEGSPAFLKVFDVDRMAEDRFDSTGHLLELGIMESLDHLGIPSFIRSGVLGEEKRPYLLTELVPGETLDHRLARDFALPSYLARSLMEGLLETVAYLHALGDPVVHNELTPTNIVLDARDGQEERAVLIDFGHARRESHGPAAFPSAVDPYYLPDECYEGAVSSPATDVFSLGAIYYRTLFGMPPWGEGVAAPRHGDLRGSLLKARLEPLPIPVHTIGGELDSSVLSAIKKALSPRPDDRFNDAGAFLGAIVELARTAGPTVQSVPPVPLRPVVRKQRGFAAVAGMSELKHILTEGVIKAIREPEEYQRFGISIPSLLLYGPPGCGKTFIAERFGEELGIAFRKVTPAAVASIYKGGTQEKIARLFDAARREAPCVLFLDEVDALLPSREGELHHAYAADVNEWLVHIGSCGQAGVHLLAATNQPRRIDPAVLRAGRFDKVVYVGPPDHAARKGMFELQLSHRPLDGAIDYDELARLTKDRVSSDIKFLVDEAAREALTTGTGGIGMPHLLDAIRRNGPSVGPGLVADYEKMRREFEPERSGKPVAKKIGFGQPEQGGDK